MKLVNVTLGVLSLFLLNCSEGKKDDKSTESNSMDFSDLTKNLAGSKESAEARYGFIRSNLVVILAEELKGDSTSIKLLDFKDESGSFIPVFTSKEKYNESSQGNKLGKGIIEISGMLMISIMNDNDRIRLNPGLKDDAFYEVKEIKARFKKEIEAFKASLNGKK